MKRNGDRRWRRIALVWLAGWYELLMALPLLLLADVYLTPERLDRIWLLLLPLFSAIGAALGLRLTRLWMRLAVALLLAGVVPLLEPDPARSALGGALVCAAALSGASAWQRLRRTAWYGAGVGVYFAASVLFSAVDGLRGYMPMLTVAGTLCLAVALLAGNRLHLQDVAMADRAPPALRRHNRLFIGVLLAATLLLAGGLGGVLTGWVGDALRTAVGWLLGLLRSSGEQAPMPMPSATPSPPMMLPPAGEPGPLSRFLDVLAYAVGAAAIAVLAGYVIHRLYRHGGGWVRRWLDRLLALLNRESRRPAAAGFVDEETGLFSWEEARRQLMAGRLGRLLRRDGDRWERMSTGRERVRFLYRRWLRANAGAGYEIRPALTPRETGADVARWQTADGAPKRLPAEAAVDADLLEWYERVRYDEAADIPDEAVERLRHRAGAGDGR